MNIRDAPDLQDSMTVACMNFYSKLQTKVRNICDFLH